MAGQTIINLGTGGAALNGQSGSTTGADSNDPLFLDWPGHNRASYVYLSGAAGNYLSVPDETALDITGDLDVRVHAALDDWTPAAFSCLVTKGWLSATDRAWDFGINATTGTLSFASSADGATTAVSVSSSVAPTVTDGNSLWLRVTFDVDNGAGGNDVKFWTSPDGTTWTQLGSTQTTAGATSIRSSALELRVGQRVSGSALPLSGKVYRAQVLSGIGGTTVLDIDTSVIASGAATSFTALTGQTVTIGRATSGRKSVAVVSPVWSLGTDDYIEVADHPLLDFSALESFTLIAAHRAWATQGTNDVLVAKKANTTATTAGWSLTGGTTTALQGQGQFGDGSAGVTAVSASRTSGALSVTATVRDVSADTLTTYLNGTAGTPATDTTTGSVANSEVLRVGRLSGAGTEYADIELLAVAVFRRALTTAEVSAITTYYQARLS